MKLEVGAGSTDSSEYKHLSLHEQYLLLIVIVIVCIYPSSSTVSIEFKTKALNCQSRDEIDH